jgi:hypothetical protein
MAWLLVDHFLKGQTRAAVWAYRRDVEIGHGAASRNSTIFFEEA